MRCKLKFRVDRSFQVKKEGGVGREVYESFERLSFPESATSSPKEMPLSSPSGGVWSRSIDFGVNAARAQGLVKVI